MKLLEEFPTELIETFLVELPEELPEDFQEGFSMKPKVIFDRSPTEIPNEAS